MGRGPLKILYRDDLLEDGRLDAAFIAKSLLGGLFSWEVSSDGIIMIRPKPSLPIEGNGMTAFLDLFAQLRISRFCAKWLPELVRNKNLQATGENQYDFISDGQEPVILRLTSKQKRNPFKSCSTLPEKHLIGFSQLHIELYPLLASLWHVV